MSTDPAAPPALLSPLPPGRRLVAVVLSFCMPGTGHVLLGRAGRGLAWLLVPFVLAALVLWQPVYSLLGILLSIPLAALDAALVRPGPVPPWPKAILRAVSFALLALAMRGGLRAFVVEGFRIPASSMLPTLVAGDHVMARKFGLEARRGALIIFRYPEDRAQTFVKRVVALAGDTVAIRAGQLVVDGAPAPTRPVDVPCPQQGEPSPPGACRVFEEELGGISHRILRHDGAAEADWPSAQSPCPAHTTAADDGRACKVDPGHALVLGDNRDNSHDSRAWGALPLTDVVAVPQVVWLSLGANGDIDWKRLRVRLR